MANLVLMADGEYRNVDRYLEIVRWARRRYTVRGELVLQIGERPSAYTRIEDAAAAKYLACSRRYG